MNAKPIIQVGIALIFLGLTAFIHPRVSSISRDMVVDISLIQSGANNNETTVTPSPFQLSPVTGGLVFASGILLVIIGIKKST